MARTQKQAYLPGTEPADDPNIEAVNEALDAWNGAKQEQKTASEATKIRHMSLVETMLEHGLDRYPYIDAATGKKKHVVIKRDPRAATTNAPRIRREDAEPGEAVEPPDASQTVEHRKVSRSSVANEVDPFAATRAALDKLGAVDVTVTAGGETTSLITGKKRKGK